MKVTYFGTKRGIRLTDAITRSITQLDALNLKYINIVPAECTAMVGDAFNSDNFIRDHNAAFNALKNFEFDRINSSGRVPRRLALYHERCGHHFSFLSSHCGANAIIQKCHWSSNRQ